jgi:hypothetical protein
MGRQGRLLRVARDRSRMTDKAFKLVSIHVLQPGRHKYLKEKGVPHIWHVDSNAHDATEWTNNLYLFAQHTFK